MDITLRYERKDLGSIPGRPTNILMHSVMAARLDRVVEVRFLREYGNVNPHREERFDSFCIDFFRE